MARRSGTVAIDYDGQAGGAAAAQVRAAVLGTGEAAARASDAHNLRGVLDRQYGGSIGRLASRMAGGETSGKAYLASRRQVERILNGTRPMTSQARAKIVAVSDKRLREVKQVRTAPARKPGPAPLQPGHTYAISMQYRGEVEQSEDNRDRTLGEEEFEFDPADDPDLLAAYLEQYGFDSWSGEGEVSFSVEEVT